MNWGWYSDDDARWYSGTGSWYVDGIDANGNLLELNYDYERKMITGF